MACSCKTAKTESKGVVTPVPELPHEVLPGESCIFCADKHVSTAYTMLLSGEPLYALTGELELARRHTAIEFQDVSHEIALLEYKALLHDEKGVRTSIEDVVRKTAETALDNDPDARKEGEQYVIDSADEIVHNPFIGALHYYAAWRLAFEVGYMMPNRSMIIGDLDLAREHLVRFDYGLNTVMRDLRHRVQTIRAADIHIYWPYTAQGIDKLLTANLPEYIERYSGGLGKRIGIDG